MQASAVKAAAPAVCIPRMPAFQLPLLLALFVSGSSANSQLKMHPLQMRGGHLPWVNGSVLGNIDMRDMNQMANLAVPRKHLYVADITVGTPPQAMRCLIDSGTADFWIPSKKCTECKTQNHFFAIRSRTFMPAVAQTLEGPMPVPVRVQYGAGGQVVGFLVQDTVEIGHVTLHNQSFLLVQEEQLPFHRDFDGICGLGWRRMAAAETGQELYRHYTPLSDNLERNGADAVFCLIPAPKRNAAFVVVGEVPMDAIQQSTLAWGLAEALTASDDKTFWITAGHLQAGRRQERVRFLVDTASQYILAPKNKFEWFVKSLFPESVFQHHCGIDKGAGNIVVCDCNIVKRYPVKVSFKIGGQSYDMDLPKLFRPTHSHNGPARSMCVLQVQRNPEENPDPWELLGDVLGQGHRRPEVDMPFQLTPNMPLLLGPFIHAALKDTYTKTAKGDYCPDGMDVIEPKQCKDAARTLNLQYAGEYMGEGEHRFCFYAGDKRKAVFFNRAGEKAAATPPSGDYASICWKPGMPLAHLVLHQPPDRRLNESDATEAAIAASDTRTHDESRDTNARRLGLLEDTWVLGAPFLENFAVILDFTHSRIGFAVPAGPIDDAPPESMLERQQNALEGCPANSAASAHAPYDPHWVLPEVSYSLVAPETGCMEDEMEEHQGQRTLAACATSCHNLFVHSTNKGGHCRCIQNECQKRQMVGFHLYKRTPEVHFTLIARNAHCDPRGLWLEPRPLAACATSCPERFVHSVRENKCQCVPDRCAMVHTADDKKFNLYRRHQYHHFSWGMFLFTIFMMGSAALCCWLMKKSKQRKNITLQDAGLADEEDLADVNNRLAAE